MKTLLLALALAASALSFGQTTPDTSTPDKTVLSFWAAWNAQDAKTLLSLMADFQPAKDMDKQVVEMMKETPLTATATDPEVFLKEGDAIVVYHLKLAPGNGSSDVMETDDMVRVHQTPEGWRIVKPKARAMGAATLGALVGYLQSSEFTRSREQRGGCANNIRQIGLGIIMYAGDYDDVMKFEPAQASVRKAVAPYLKNERLWECPDHPGIAFSFNVKLANKSFVDIDDPMNTVMVYEGEKGELNFRHDGKAWVCFADGHVKAVSKEEAAKLIWTAKK